MRPVLLEMDGFASFRKPAVVDFRDADYFALIGPTGSGKSTVIDAMTFALYGSAPRWDNLKVISNALAPTATRCTVRLVFDSAGSRYVVAREVRRTAAGGASQKNARLELLADPQSLDVPGETTTVLAADSEVTAAVEQLLSLPFGHFTTCVVLPQGDFAEFLHATPAKRQEILVKLLGLEVYKTIGQAAHTRADSLQQSAQLRGEQLEQLGDVSAAAQQNAEEAVTSLEDLAARVVGDLLPELTRLADRVEQAQRSWTALRSEADLLEAFVTPEGLDDLALRQRRTDQELKNAAQLLAKAEAVDQKARDAINKARPRHILEEEGRAHASLTEAERQLPKLKATQQLDRETLEAAEAAISEAEDELEQAAHERDEAFHADAAAGLRPTLHIGDPCPVCTQKVRSLPEALAAPDLHAAQTTMKHAEETLALARSKRDDAFAVSQRSSNAVTEATTTIGKLRERLAAAPAADVVASELIALERLEATARNADQRLRDARTTHDQANKGADNIRAELDQAWTDLLTARDPLVALGAPDLPYGDIGAAWQILTTWVQQEATDRTEDLIAATSALSEAQDRVSRAESQLATALAEHRITPDPERAILVAAEPAVVRSVESAKGCLNTVIDRRQRAAELEKLQQRDMASRTVAKMLGDLLRADRFQRWLLSTALDTLVYDASATLRELSGGQFDLTHDKGSFFVIDHSDADSLRPVKTLSGGETFQASLALALALSSQLSNMATASAARLESIFLDEGFGTLDETTLETVAATLEELSFRGQRMVGVVTHVNALAERVPVRFAVIRDQHTSSVRREEL